MLFGRQPSNLQIVTKFVAEPTAKYSDATLVQGPLKPSPEELNGGHFATPLQALARSGTFQAPAGR